MTPEHLKKLLKDILTQLQDAISRAEFTEAFKTVTSLVLDTERKVVSKADSAIKELKDTFDKARTDLEEGTLSDFASLKQSLSDAVSKALREQENGMNFIRDKARQITKGKEGERGPAGPPGKDGKDAIETPESVRDKLETLKDEERLDASAVKNLPQFVEQTGTKAGWGAHPLKILDDGVVIDKVARIINFTGGTVTRSRDGTINVAQGTTTTPGSPDTSVQFNDGGSFGGTALKYGGVVDGSMRFSTANASGSGVNATSFQFTGGNGTAGDAQGAGFAVTGGNGFGAEVGGGFSVSGGTGGATGEGGAVSFSGGSGGATSGSGGSISLTAGSAQGGDSDGGDILIQAGAKTGAGVAGQLEIYAGDGETGIDFSESGGFRFNGPTELFRFSGVGVGAVLDTSAITSTDKTFTFPDVTSTFTVTSGHARATGQTAANTNVLTVTVGAADATLQVLANVLVTTSTTHSITVTVDYTDEGNTARTLTLPFSQLAGTIITAITNVTGAGPYEGVPLTIRAKAATTVVFKTAGTFTTITYNVDASVIQVA